MGGAYAGAAVKPQIAATSNAFKIVLPNVNFVARAAEVPATAGEGTSTIPDSRENEILRFLTEHPSITRKEAQTLLGVSQSTAGRLLREMVDRGQIMTLGGSRASRCELPWRSAGGGRVRGGRRR